MEVELNIRTLYSVLVFALVVPAHGQLVDSVEHTSLPVPHGALDTTTITFRDSDIREVMRGLAVQHGLNVFIDNSISKRVTVSLNRVQVHEAIKFLCEQNGLVMAVEPPAPRSQECCPGIHPGIYPG
jgi:type II secretory pathway component HofQ